ncbi:hypothetical protein FTV88_0810 [Heliorestis convoluta]|uniref:Uncharacterized protein n=1 Tax=Heliorestis convoluta TaxID=356322 RepID=A0A5Q2N3X6_9FIRM|nr:hypothetical protein FTV88_0810 [Heliorestis convoluta]
MFGMGTGVSPPPSLPDLLLFFGFYRRGAEVAEDLIVLNLFSVLSLSLWFSQSELEVYTAESLDSSCNFFQSLKIKQLCKCVRFIDCLPFLYLLPI